MSWLKMGHLQVKNVYDFKKQDIHFVIGSKGEKKIFCLKHIGYSLLKFEVGRVTKTVTTLSKGVQNEMT